MPYNASMYEPAGVGFGEIVMAANAVQLLLATLVLVLLTLVVGLAMLTSRVREMRARRIHPQSVPTAATMAAKLEHTQAADNFRNLFETPVLYYALVAIALGLDHVPAWLSLGAWVYVGLRVLHSLIHCTYNTVYHRFAVFLLSLALLQGLWIAFVVELI